MCLAKEEEVGMVMRTEERVVVVVVVAIVGGGTGAETKEEEASVVPVVVEGGERVSICVYIYINTIYDIWNEWIEKERIVGCNRYR